MGKSISELIMDFFKEHPNEDFEHGPVVDWVTEEYKKDHASPPRDPWRAIRNLHQQGILIKVAKGIYRYDSECVELRDIEDFTTQQKKEIFKRDGYRCVVCGLGIADGMEIHADHIKPKELGGRAEIENGQTLCATHNFRKKTYKQTETGKRMFIRLYELAITESDDELAEFCKSVLEQYENHGINDHIKWTPKLL